MPDSFRRTAIAALLVSAAATCLFAMPSRATMPSADGRLPDAVRTAFEAGLFALPPRSPALATSTTQVEWNVPLILVSYTDAPLQSTAADFEHELFDTTGTTPTGSVYDYYLWASGNRIHVKGTVVATIALPFDRYYYAFASWGLNPVSTPNNMFGLIRDALYRCPSTIDWSQFDMNGDGFVDMLWITHAGTGGEGSGDPNDMWSITSRLSNWSGGEAFVTPTLLPGSTTQHVRIDRFSMLPEQSSIAHGSRAEIGVYCHEFGHALGLPDLYNTHDRGFPDSGTGNWSLMSTGGWGGDGHSPEYPTHPGAWCSLFLGWTTAVRPSQDTLITLGPLIDGSPLIELTFQGEPNPEHFLVENRVRRGFDRNLPSDGLIVYHLDESLIGQRLPNNSIQVGAYPGLRVVEADGHFDLAQGQNHGDARDPFPGALDRTFLYDTAEEPSTKTFLGASTSIGLFAIQQLGDSVRFRAQVRPPGWLPTQEITEPGFDPISSSGAAVTTVHDSHGTIYSVYVQTVASHPQVFVRSGHEGTWTPSLQLSASPSAALDPTIGALPNGDLVVVWSDTRAAKTRLFCRTRVLGTWTAERVLVDLPGESRTPAIGMDARGAAHLAWIYTLLNRPRIMFMRFSYLSPFGMPLAVTPSGLLPEPPSVAVAASGRSYIVWAERATSPAELWFCRYHPDSGLSARERLTPFYGLTQTHAFALADSAGALYTSWIVSGPGQSEVHFQRRSLDRDPYPADTTVVSQGDITQNQRIALDPTGAVHLVYETLPITGPQVRYKRAIPGRGWDAQSTWVSSVSDGSATLPQVIADSPGNLTILHVDYVGNAPHLRSRRRSTDRAPELAVPPAPPDDRVRFALGPNPLRAGQTLQLRGVALLAGGGGRWVDVVDLAGRRVASAAVEGDGAAARARFGASSTAAWTSGVYFALPRGARGGAVRLVVLR